ncbi:thermonuclease family protein [Fretibacter rubidus]|uniref:thermonuclease family protein n=1 Tax=Fretibacter rubidus TaxID=570162 RepID=UPI00352B1404
MSATPPLSKLKIARFSGRWARRMAALAGALFIGAAGTAMKTPPLIAGEIGMMSSVVDGDTLFLANGLKVRLSAIQAPKLPLGRKGFKAWPLGEDAKAALTQLTQNRRVQLYYGGEQRDRYGRALAQIFTLTPTGERDLWVQEEMIKRGLARVYTWPDTYQNSDILYKAERDARASNRGIWALDYYKVRSPDPNALAQDVDSFQIIEGIVTSVADVRGRIYLNFGADYKTDFTVAIAKRNRKRFAKEGLDPLSLEGARVRVRGWVELTNGPMIWLDTATRLEVLDGQES